MENRITISGKVSDVSIRKEGVSDRGNAWTLYSVRLENCPDAGLREGEEGPLAFSTFQDGIREGQFIEQDCRVTGYDKSYENPKTGESRSFVALSLSAVGDVSIVEEGEPVETFGKAAAKRPKRKETSFADAFGELEEIGMVS